MAVYRYRRSRRLNARDQLSLKRGKGLVAAVPGPGAVRSYNSEVISGVCI